MSEFVYVKHPAHPDAFQVESSYTKDGKAYIVAVRYDEKLVRQVVELPAAECWRYDLPGLHNAF